VILVERCTHPRSIAKSAKGAKYAKKKNAKKTK